MRKTMTRMGLGLALVVGAAGAAAAQNARPDTSNRQAQQRERGERGDRGMRGDRRRGGPEAALLKGITLTDAQKTRVEALRKEQRDQSAKSREQFGAVMKEAREARQRGDTATARAKMTEVRTQMDAQRERHLASLRTILTTEQQRQFDANVAEWKERAAKRGEGRERGAWNGRRDRGARPRSGSGR